MRYAWLVAGVPAIALSVITEADEVHLRGGSETVVGAVTAMTDAGVTIEQESGGVQLISWDRVREITVDAGSSEHEPFLQRADDLWRARTRLEREDAALAKPLFERWFDVYRGQTNETALVVAEGLLRCRLRDGEHAAAVLPALETARIRRAGVTTGAFTSLAQMLDDESGLCMTLAPFWVADRSMREAAEQVAAYDANGDEVVESLAQLYHMMLLQEIMDAATVEEMTRSEEPGVRLLALLASAAYGEQTQQDRAQHLLLRFFENEPPLWKAAWIHFAIGASQSAAGDSDVRRRGLLHLAYLPARFGEEQPYLAGIALWRMSNALAEFGEADASTSLRAELERRYPEHPILHIEQITFVPNPSRDQT